MKLITKEIQALLPNIDATEGIDAQHVKVPLKLFHPMSNWTWYVTEFNPETGEMFGMVHGFEKELGFFTLQELEEVKVHGLGIERDMYWDSNNTLGQVMAGEKS